MGMSIERRHARQFMEVKTLFALLSKSTELNLVIRLLEKLPEALNARMHLCTSVCACTNGNKLTAQKLQANTLPALKCMMGIISIAIGVESVFLVTCSVQG
eukprot:1158376-Pelagomonas_calceolata.AAC.20